MAYKATANVRQIGLSERAVIPYSRLNAAADANQTSLTLQTDDAKALLEFINSGGALAPSRVVVNDLGIGAELHRAERVNAAIANPGNYVTARNTAIEAVGKRAAADYQTELLKLFEIGLP